MAASTGVHHPTANRFRWVAVAAALLASSHATTARADEPALLVPSPAAHYPPGTHYKPLCPSADAQGRKCSGHILVGADDRPISDATSPPGGWTPTELEAAYGLPANGGSAAVIATYIGSHYTNAESDVAAYRAKFNMPPCTSANGCFMQTTDTGGTDFSGLSDDGCSGFVGEESLDVDMLMAGCPNCKILVIEGNDYASAMATALHKGAVSMSMSWGYSGSSTDCTGVWVPPAGLTLFAASGDSGYAAPQSPPAICQNVVAVGWTQLATDNSTRGYADTIPAGWGSAGGCQSGITKPSWQTDNGCSTRMISDVSANGDNVAAYCTSPGGSANWHVTGGSSASSPFTSGVLAALGITGGSFSPSWLYANQAKFWDVTTGGPVANCPSGSPEYFCNGVPGYDGPSGVGTPYGPMLVGGDGGTGPGNPDSGGGSTCTTPGGSYQSSCTGCAAEAAGSGCVLTCMSCKQINGNENPNPSLPLPCNGTIVNNDGALQCMGSPGADAGGNADSGAVADAGPILDAGSGGGGLDSTVPPVPDASAGLDSGSIVSQPDGATGGFGDNPGVTTGSAGCTCTEARGARSPGWEALVAAGLFLAGVARRRRSRLSAT
jgi:hypothetical protein